MHVNEEQGCKVIMGKNWSAELQIAQMYKCIVTVCGLYSVAEHAVEATNCGLFAIAAAVE